jgi:tetratricopeptide (TPR) repeat protein
VLTGTTDECFCNYYWSSNRLKSTCERYNLNCRLRQQSKRGMSALTTTEQGQEGAANELDTDGGLTSTDNDAQRVEAYKKQGNLQFTSGKYNEAVDLYSKGIELDGENHILYGNRAASYLKMEMYVQALRDAQMSVQIEPKWIKGYHRAATAYIALGRLNEAIEQYEKALQIKPDEKSFKRLLKSTRSMLKTSRSNIKNMDQWLKLHRGHPDIRMRLGIMAEFWNLSRTSERLMIFNAFLNIISGVTRNAPNMPKYSKKDMSELPMKNYEDLVFPYEWIQYYKGLTPDGKVKHFESMFRNASEHEKTLIINDLKHFFQAPV